MVRVDRAQREVRRESAREGEGRERDAIDLPSRFCRNLNRRRYAVNQEDLYLAPADERTDYSQPPMGGYYHGVLNTGRRRCVPSSSSPLVVLLLADIPIRSLPPPSQPATPTPPSPASSPLPGFPSAPPNPSSPKPPLLTRAQTGSKSSRSPSPSAARSRVSAGRSLGETSRLQRPRRRAWCRSG